MTYIFCKMFQFTVFIIVLSKMSLVLCDQCSFPRDISQHSAIHTIEPLFGNHYSVDDNGSPDLEDLYMYQIGICTTPSGYEKKDDNDNVGIIQSSKKDHEIKVIGKFDSAEIKGGSNWVMLEYLEGDNYTSHCSHGKRKAVIMIICSEKEESGVARLIEENNDKSAGCYYLFEIDHSAVCSKPEPTNTGLGTGAILFVVFIVLLVLYFAIGFGYQRYIAGAKGIEQMPNLVFWRYLGNLFADGCNYICRCGFASEESKPYRPVETDNMESEDSDRIDDNLLPM